jgi:pimeloyl-ACP methyl ester carboxylesterase
MSVAFQSTAAAPVGNPAARRAVTVAVPERRSRRRWVRRALVVAGIVVSLVVLGAAGLRTVLARQQAIESADGVHEAGYVTIGGRPQWIEIRGWHRTNPVILWLHGGPGGPVLPISYASFLPWERTFSIAHWHQPGAGLTYAAAPDAALTIDRMADDGIEVAEYLRARLGQERLILVGHSWGSILGTRMAQRRPELFAAYVGTGQMNSLEDDGRDLFAAAMARATSASNAAAIAALEGVAALPPTDVRRMDAVRKWGKTEDMADNPLLVLIAPLLSPGYPLTRTLSVARGFDRSRRALFDEELRVRLERDVPELAVPAFLFQGKDDWQVSTPAAVRFFQRLRAPAKEIVLFDGGHFVHVFHSDEFLAALTSKVRPLAVRSGAPRQ